MVLFYKKNMRQLFFFIFLFGTVILFTKHAHKNRIIAPIAAGMKKNCIANVMA